MRSTRSARSRSRWSARLLGRRASPRGWGDCGERLAVARLARRSGGAAAAPAAAGDGAASGRCARCRRRIRSARPRCSPPASWLWTLVANVASDGSAAPLPYLPFLNPLDIGIGIALAAALLWLQRTADRVAPWSLAMAAGAGFVWLNAILVRSFHHYAGVPYHFDAWLASLAVQTGITLLWTAIALVTMWFAATRGRALPWMVGAACSRPSCSSCSLVDLSGSGTRDADRLVHRRRRADARHRLRRAVAGQGGAPCAT